MISLGVNIDHIATLRNARGENDPDLIDLAMLTQVSGADLITIHLREDRRHIRDADVFALKEKLKIPLNFEMALSDEILAIALQVKPATACVVPERREEITTEGGLDAVKFKSRIAAFVKELHGAGIETYLFIEPDTKAVEAAAAVGARGVEFHTGAYARAFQVPDKKRAELERLHGAAELAHQNGLVVHAGHGLNVSNVGAICRLPHVTELNIGHAIIARSLTLGLANAIQEMRTAMLGD